MPVKIRPFLPADHAQAIDLWARTPGMGTSRADEEAHVHAFLQRNPGLSFVADDGGEIVATILTGHDGRRGLIHHMAVDPRYHRQGLAGRLTDQALAGLYAAGIFKCHLLCFADNAAGRAFWEAEGATERSEVALYSFETRPLQP